jgi:hypothetical protein
MKLGGRRRDEQWDRRQVFMVCFGLTKKQASHLTREKMDQLDRCASDDAKRVLLFGGKR